MLELHRLGLCALLVSAVTCFSTPNTRLCLSRTLPRTQTTACNKNHRWWNRGFRQDDIVQRWMVENDSSSSSGDAIRRKADGDGVDIDEDDLSAILGTNGEEVLEDVAEEFVWTDKVRNYFKSKDDGLTSKQRLAKMGLAAALSYGWVSNMSYSVSVSLAWYISCTRTGLSPLVAGQWKNFLTVYAGFFVFNNIVRPVRLAVAMTISPKFDQIINSVQKRLNISKGKAIFVVVFMGNVVGTCTAMAAGIAVASLAAGVPVFPGKGPGVFFSRLFGR